MAKCIECFFCKNRAEGGDKIMKCSVSGRTLTEESEACSNLMKKK